MSENIIKKTTKGVIWAGIDRFGVVLLQFVVNLVLARMLTPDDFGLVGMILIFVAVSQTLIDGGLGSALIQKLNPSQEDYSTIFWWNIIFSVVLYSFIYIIAPYVAIFFHIPKLSLLLRVIGVIVIINAFSLVQRTKLRKLLSFKKIAITDIISYLCSALLTIYLAHNEYGVWSLVAMQIATSIISVLIFWSISKWYPSWEFSLYALKHLFSYGGYLLIASVMQDVCTHIQGVVIGRKFSAATTGLYTQAKKMDEVASMTIPSIFCQVLFPVFSEQQKDYDKLINTFKVNTQLIAFIIFPLMMLLIIIAKPIFLLLYGDQWIDAVPYFQVLCIGGFFSALYNLGYYVIAAIGKSKVLFYWGCYKWGMLILLLIIGASISMNAVLIAMVISNLNIYITNSLLVHHYIKYSLLLQIKDIMPTIICTLITGGILYLISIHTCIHWVVLSAIFIMLYLSICYLFKIRAILEFNRIINNLIKKYIK